MTVHAMEEMAEDNLDILDIEQAILTGSVVRRESRDPRGSKYIIEGIAIDGLTQVGIVGRFTDNSRYLILTVYEVNKDE